jgi:predicted nucleic acid-binding protein
VAVYFFDSSALVKRYVQERGSAWVRSLMAPQAGHALYVARITAVEVVAAIARRQRGGALTATDAMRALTDFQYDLTHQYRLVEITPLLITEAMRLATTYALRGYDAVQLAAARTIEAVRAAHGLPPLSLVSADDALNTAARAETLTVDDPNTH